MSAIFWEGSVAASASRVASSAPVKTPGCGMKNMQRWQFSTTAQQDWCCPWTGTCALRIPLQLSPFYEHRKVIAPAKSLPENKVNNRSGHAFPADVCPCMRAVACTVEHL